MGTNQAIRLKALPQKERSQVEMAAEGFYLDRQAQDCTAATLIWYRKYVGALVESLAQQGVRDLSQVTAAQLREWLVGLRERGLADWTVHHHAAAARTFFNFCEQEGLVTVSPMRRVKMPRLPKEILPAFTPDEIKRLLAACRTLRDTAVVLCLLDSGCRSAEFIGLNVGDVDMSSGAVTIKQGKGKKDRTVFLGTKARKSLWRYLKERGQTKDAEPLWLSENTGERLTTWGLSLLVERLGTRAGVADCHCHKFRRSFALWSLRSGMDIFSLQRLMGHAGLDVLRKYLDQVKEDLQEAHRKYGAVDNML